MVVGVERTRIQNALVDAAMAGKFYAVSYDKTTKHATADTSAPKVPAEVLVNEIRASFLPAKQQGRRKAFDRDQWQFQMRIGFQGEVAAENFESSICDPPLVLNPDPANGFPRAIVLELTSAVYQHPTQQEPQPGTRIVLIISARYLTPL